MSYWARPELERDQIVLIATTLSDRIPEDHSVRLFAELLAAYDWSGWEAEYNGRRGQPPIHPRVVAGVLLYGLTQGLRSSRRLEWACGHAVDYMWLAEGRVIDHSTLCDFRTTFGEKLKDLFRHLGRLAQAMGVVRLNHVGIDGTREAASSSRHGTRTAETLEAELKQLDEKLATMLKEAEEVDRREAQTLFGEDRSPATTLPKDLAQVKQRQARLNDALARLKQRQTAGSRQTQVALADPDAPVLPNKGGGFAPNYTPVLAVDSGHKFIVAETVQADEGEARALLPLLDEVQETFGEPPQTATADSGFCTRENLVGLAQRPTDAYIAPSGERLEGPNQTPSSRPGVAERADVRTPLAAQGWAELPRTKKGLLAKEAFVYEQSSDTYWCPLGRALPLLRVEKETVRKGESRVTSERRVYACGSCAGCPLRAQCAGEGRDRRLRSRGADPLREAMAAKVHSPAGRTIYKQRQSVAESPFGVIKAVMNVRQFLLRGLAKVKKEWNWVCTAYNLRILVRWLGRQRAAAGAALGT